jgi:hypothetical protein
MKITITTKTKSKNPSQKELDKSVDLVLEAGEVVAHKLKGFDICRCKCYRDGTSLILKKK